MPREWHRAEATARKLKRRKKAGRKLPKRGNPKRAKSNYENISTEYLGA